MEQLVEERQMDRASTARRVAELLRRRIADGKIEPGERLNELALSGELGVSRSPIREALALLAGEGLVRVVPYKGTFVTALSNERLKDLLDFRLALEEFAVRRAVERAQPKDWDHLESLIAEIAAQADMRNLSGAVDADLRVHQYLIELAGSPLLSRTYGAMLGEMRLYIAQTVRHYQGPIELATEHRAFLEAARRRDVAGATALIAAHISHGFSSALKENA